MAWARAPGSPGHQGFWRMWSQVSWGLVLGHSTPQVHRMLQTGGGSFSSFLRRVWLLLPILHLLHCLHPHNDLDGQFLSQAMLVGFLNSIAYFRIKLLSFMVSALPLFYFPLDPESLFLHVCLFFLNSLVMMIV